MSPNAHSVICHGDICCSFSYMSWWHLLLTQIYVIEWSTNVTITYNWVSNKCHNHIQLSEQQMSPWHITESAKNVTMTYNWTIVAHSVLCHGDFCCSLSYMSWWHFLLTQLYVMVTFLFTQLYVIVINIIEWSTNVTITYNWVSNKCLNQI
jgi:UDP-2,3-diacylglucosamine pyrophosphatase LpxH